MAKDTAWSLRSRGTHDPEGGMVAIIRDADRADYLYYNSKKLSMIK